MNSIMKQHPSKSPRGFTLIEVTLVIVVMGLLMAGLAPLLLRQHTGTMEARDATALEDAKTAIINYAITYGGIPDPLPIASGTGQLVTPFLYPVTLALSQPAGLMPPSNSPTATDFYAVPPFGVNNWGVFGGNSSSLYAFHLDVNDHLKSSYIKWISTNSALTYDNYLAANNANSAAGADVHQSGDRVVFCQAVREQMAANNGPQICQNFDSRIVAGVTTVCAATTPSAFALFSTGSNRMADQENDDRMVATALKTNRIYENDSRGIINSQGESLYDDQVKSYPLSAFARDCREKMGVSSEVMSCAPGQKFVGSVTNGHSSTPYYYAITVDGVTAALSSYVPANGFSTYANACFARSAKAGIGLNAVAALNAAIVGAALSTRDSNTDGRIDFLIDTSGNLTSQ